MKKAPQKAPQKNQILAVANPVPTQENKSIATQRTKWVPFFKDSNNTYINDLALRYRRTATLNSIINSKVNYAVGYDFTYMKEDNEVEFKTLDSSLKEFIYNANVDMQGLREVYKDILFQWICFGNVWIHVVRSKVGNQESKNLFILDATKVRVSKDGSKCFVSAFWRDIKNSESFNEKDYPMETLEMWNKKIDTTQQNYVIHLKRSVPEYDYYGLPDYIATLKDCDIEYKVDTYNLDRLENGFFPSVSITQVGNPPEGMTPVQYVQKIKDSYTGEGQGGKMVVQLVDDKETAPIIQEFSGTKEGEFTQLEDSAFNGIVRGSRFFPQLAGIETANGLGGNQIIINQWKIVMANVIRPDYQEPTLKLLNMILKMFGFDIKIDVAVDPPVNIDDKINPNDVLDVNEQREVLGFKPIEDNGNDNGQGE